MAPRKGGPIFYALLLVAFLFPAFSALPSAAQSAAQQDWIIVNQEMQAKNPAAALPYLERLVRDYPEVVLYRLELGYALYLLKRDGRAKYHFKQALGANLTAQQRVAVDNALANIEKRKIWTVRLGFNLEPATNPGKGTAAGGVAVGDLVLTIPNNLRSKPATGVIVSAGATYRPKITDKLDATFSLDGVIKHYGNTALRETLVVGRAGLRFELRQNAHIEGGVLLGKTYAAGSPYSDRAGVYANLTARLGERSSTRLDFESYRVKHDTFTLADGRPTRIGGQFVYALSPNALLRARGYVMHTDAASPLQSGWQGALALGGTYAFKGGLVAMLDLTVGRDIRDGVNALTGTRRADTSQAIEAEFFDSKFQVGGFLPVLRLKLEKNRSNQVLNSYTDRSIGFGLRTSF